MAWRRRVAFLPPAFGSRPSTFVPRLSLAVAFFRKFFILIFWILNWPWPSPLAPRPSIFDLRLSLALALVPRPSTFVSHWPWPSSLDLRLSSPIGCWSLEFPFHSPLRTPRSAFRVPHSPQLLILPRIPKPLRLQPTLLLITLTQPPDQPHHLLQPLHSLLRLQPATLLQ